MTNLKSLLSSATVGSREIDAAVARWLGWTPHDPDNDCWNDERGRHHDLLFDWSTSLDAAVALVQEKRPNHEWSIWCHREAGDYRAEVCPCREFKKYNHSAPTAPLAILLALISSEPRS